MSSPKISSLAVALGVCSGALLLSACSTVNDAWTYFTDDNNPGLRTPTGYYDHSNTKDLVDPLQVPAGYDAPFTDSSLAVPQIEISAQSRAMVGDAMDVRPPVVPHTEELGVEIVTNEDTAVAWFLPHSSLNVQSEEQAWTYLNSVLSYLKIPVAERNEYSYAIATAPFDYNPYGEPYDAVSEEFGVLRYRQVYKIQVGQSSSGQVGYAINLLSSSTAESDGSDISDRINPRQRSSFLTGFANTLIKTLVQQSRPQDVLPNEAVTTLGRDNNDQDALLVDLPYQTTWNVLRGLLDKYSFTIEEFSISSSSFTVSYKERNSYYYKRLGIQPFGLESDDYIIRVGVNGNGQSVITFYDEDDKPLKAITVAALYPAFSQVIAQEYALYKSNPSEYVANFKEED